MSKKDFRDYTVGELLDMGLDVQCIRFFEKEEEKARELVQKLVDVVDETQEVDSKTKAVIGKSNVGYQTFEITVFVKKGVL